MRNPSIRILAMAAAPLLFVAAAAAQTSSQTAPPAPAAPAAPAAGPAQINPEAVLDRACRACHDLGVITQRPHTPDEWPLILQQMRANGANISDAEQKALVEYLQQNYSATA